MTAEYHFTVILEPDEEGGFTVRVPAIPEVVTCGETEEEALRMAEEAIRLAIEYRRDNDEPLPVAAGVQLRDVKVVVPV